MTEAAKKTTYALPDGIRIEDAESHPHHQSVLDGQTTADPKATCTLHVTDGPSLLEVSVLAFAALVGNAEFIRHVHSGPDKDLLTTGAHCSEKRTIAEFACRGGHLNVVKLLFELGLPLNNANDNGSVPIFIAVQAGHFDVVKFLVEQANVPVTCTNKNKLTLLHAAVVHTRVDLLRFLLGLHLIDKDAHCAVQDDTGDVIGECTAFAMACGEGPIDAVKLLFGEGAHLTNLREATQVNKQSIRKLGESETINLADAEKRNVLYFRKIPGFPVMVVPAASATAPSTSTTAATTTDAAAAAASSSSTTASSASAAAPVKAIAEYVVQLEVKRERSNSPVHRAAEAGNLDILQFLIEQAGFAADKNVRIGGVTALYLACRYSRLDVLKWLVEVQRCDLDLPTADGATPIYAAAFFNLPDVARYLLSKGCNSSIQYRGASPFFGAIAGGSLETLKLLVEFNADRVTSYKGMGPLAYAKAEGKNDIAQYLANNNIT